MAKTIVLTSGYFNPLHPGHIECFELAKELGDELWVIVNNDAQAFLKRGVSSFQNEDFRMKVVAALKPVDKVISSIDEDLSVTRSLAKVCNELKLDPEVNEIIFAKGGDRFATEIPEAQVCKEFNVKIVDNLGAKTHNSSDYVKKVD